VSSKGSFIQCFPYMQLDCWLILFIKNNHFCEHFYEKFFSGNLV
jgi:hypothetical protein